MIGGTGGGACSGCGQYGANCHCLDVPDFTLEGRIHRSRFDKEAPTVPDLDVDGVTPGLASDVLARAEQVIALTGRLGDTSVARAIAIELVDEVKRLRSNTATEHERARVVAIIDEAWKSPKLRPLSRMALAVVASRIRDPMYRAGAVVPVRDKTAEAILAWLEEDGPIVDQTDPREGIEVERLELADEIRRRWGSK